MRVFSIRWITPLAFFLQKWRVLAWRRNGSAKCHALALALIVLSFAACSKSPTSPSTPAVVVHDTLNPTPSVASLDAMQSEASGALDREVYDDFVSPSAATIRTIAWQGIRPTARPLASFYIAFIADNNGYIRWEYDSTTGRQKALYATRVSIDQVNERLGLTKACDTAPQQQCGSYDYSVTLPALFVATAGTRYWLLIQAETPFNSESGWLWRKGQPDNSFAMTNVANTLFPWDFAFALRP